MLNLFFFILNMSPVREASIQRLSARTRPIFRVGRSGGKELARGGPGAVEGRRPETWVFYPCFWGSERWRRHERGGPFAVLPVPPWSAGTAEERTLRLACRGDVPQDRP